MSDLAQRQECKDRWSQIRHVMENCYQFESMNMIQHGEAVHDWYCDLKGPCKYQWDFGSVVSQIEHLVTLADSPEHLYYYHVYHDLGKPFCRTVDENGRQHFPNHAQVSYETWIAAGGCENIGWYILHDMDFHTLRGDQLDELIKDPRAVNLLLTAWCEIHANSQMFGGIESTNFKIKRKALEKATKRVYDARIERH